jgi:hypothetical protein
MTMIAPAADMCARIAAAVRLSAAEHVARVAGVDPSKLTDGRDLTANEVVRLAQTMGVQPSTLTRLAESGVQA